MSLPVPRNPSEIVGEIIAVRKSRGVSTNPMMADWPPEGAEKTLIGVLKLRILSCTTWRNPQMRFDAPEVDLAEMEETDAQYVPGQEESFLIGGETSAFAPGDVITVRTPKVVGDPSLATVTVLSVRKQNP